MTPEIENRIALISAGKVPDGYKKGKDGIFPADWVTKPMNEWLTIAERPITLEDDKEYQLITVRRGFGGVDSRGFFYGRDILVKNYFVVHAGDFVISKRQIAHGACGVVPESLDGAVVSNEYNVFVPNEGTNIEMFNLMMQLPHYKRLFYLMSDGVHIEKLLFKTEGWLKRSIAMPSDLEQEKIAEILVKQDKLIELQQKKVDELVEQKKAYFLKMFPHKVATVPEIRFKGFTDDWERRRFSDFTHIAGKRNKENLPLEPFAITNENGFIAQKDAHEEFGYMKDTDRSAYMVVKSNSFAYNPARINVGSIGYYTGDEDVIVSSLYEVFQTSEDIDDRFLWHWLKSPALSYWIEKLQEGSVRRYFYYDKMQEITMFVPSLKEQREISEFFDSLDNTIALHQRKLEQEKQKEKALMQLLLTGIVRV